MVGILFYGWLIIAFLFLICEVGHPGLFFFLSFGIGAVVAGLSTLITESAVIQSLLFLICSIIAAFILMMCFKKRMKQVHYTTNVEALIGKNGLVIKTIYHEQTGQVKIGGEIWSARSINNEKIEKEAVVEVIAIRGVHVLVKKV
jgi:membrane protein implicated in regulation of membrane protease activity